MEPKEENTNQPTSKPQTAPTPPDTEEEKTVSMGGAEETGDTSEAKDLETSQAEEPKTEEFGAQKPKAEEPLESISISSSGEIDKEQTGEAEAKPTEVEPGTEPSPAGPAAASDMPDEEVAAKLEAEEKPSAPNLLEEQPEAAAFPEPEPHEKDLKPSVEKMPMTEEPKTTPSMEDEPLGVPAPGEKVGVSPQPSPPGEKKTRRGLLITIIVVIILGLAAAAYMYYRSTQDETAKSPPQIKVGLMMAFTGGSSSMGYGTSKGVQLAKTQLGIENIEIVQMDSKCEPTEAADAIKRLISQNVAAVIGEGCSSASVAALPAANNSKTLMLSPSASSTALSIPDDYFFRVVPSDIYQGKYLAQTIYDRGYRNVAVFYTNEPYGSSINKVFQEQFEALGGKVVATASGESDVIDLETQMTEIKDANPEAVFIAPNSVVSGTAAMKVGRNLGIKAPYFGADILYNTTIITDAPEAVDGLIITSFPTGTKAFKQAIANLADQSNEQLYAAPQAYDALHAIYIATQRGASTGEEIKAQLPSINFEGVSGRIAFDQNGDQVADNYKYDLFQVKNGTFEFVEQ